MSYKKMIDLATKGRRQLGPGVKKTARAKDELGAKLDEAQAMRPADDPLAAAVDHFAAGVFAAAGVEPPAKDLASDARFDLTLPEQTEARKTAAIEKALGGEVIESIDYGGDDRTFAAIVSTAPDGSTRVEQVVDVPGGKEFDRRQLDEIAQRAADRAQ